MNPGADILRILGGSGLREVIILPSGKRVDALPGVATVGDNLVNDAAISGYTKTLVCATSDVADLLATRDWVMRSDKKKYYIANISLMARGSATKIYLGGEV